MIWMENVRFVWVFFFHPFNKSTEQSMKPKSKRNKTKMNLWIPNTEAMRNLSLLCLYKKKKQVTENVDCDFNNGQAII